jgi:hypothetical protein
MILRIVFLVLAAALIAHFVRRWLNPRLSRRPPAPRVQAARKCETCEAYVLGAEPEPCARADCPFA